MVLPLLAGAAALMGAGQIGNMFLGDWAEDRDIDRASARNQDVLDQLGTGFNGDQFASGAFGAGIMDPEEYARTGFADARQATDNAAAMARQHVSSRAGMMNAGLNRERFEWEQGQADAEAQRMSEVAALQRRRENIVLEQAGYDPVHMSIDSLRKDALSSIGAQMTRTEAERAQEAADLAQANMTIATTPLQTAALNAEFGAAINAPQIAADSAYLEAVEPLREQDDRLARLIDMVPAATSGARWGNWFDDTTGSTNKRAASKLLFEVKQEWIDEQMKGREPSEAVQKKLDEAFEANINAFTNANQLVDFLSTLRQGLSVRMDREQVRRDHGGNAVLDTYAPPQPTGNVTSSGIRVTPDG